VNLIQLLTKFIFLSGSNILGMLASFGVVLLIVDSFGAEGLGKMALVLSVIHYCTLLSGQGIEMYAIREVSAKRQDLAEMVPSLFVVRFLAAVVIYVGMSILVVLVPSFNEQSNLFIILGLTLLILPFRSAWAAQARHDAHVLGLFNLSIELTYLLGVLVVTAFSLTLTNVAWVKVGTECIVTVSLVLWIHKRYGPLRKPLSWNKLKIMMGLAWPFASFPLLRGLALGTDLIILSFFVSTSDVGIYSGAAKLFFVLLSLTSAYFVIVYPRLSELSHLSIKAAHAEVIRLYKVILPLAFMGVFFMLLFSDFILTLLFGGEFSSGSLSLQFLTVAFIANLAARHYRQLLLVAQHQKIDFNINILVAIIHVLIKLILIPLWGIEGAALGTAVGETILLLAYLIVDRHLFRKEWVVSRR
jgi:O-antigen/teichoic acid export membrane protein